MSRLLRATRRQPVDTTPIWFMRQAGRYLPEYRRIREHHSLLEICAKPDLAAEVTLQPLARFDFDAAILFADILLPLAPLGVPFDFAPGEGPVIHKPIRSAADVDALRPVDPKTDLGHVLETVSLVRKALDPSKPLIGFGGGPFTLASYMIEGGPSRQFVETKKLMYSAPEVFDRLLGHLAKVIGAFLEAQTAAGAQVIQLFDSWAGCLSPFDYTRFVMKHSRTVLEAIAHPEVPSIHFGVHTGGLLEGLRDAGGDVIGVDWRVDLDDAWRRIGFDRGIQGNLDPLALFGPHRELQLRVRDVLAKAGGRPGHIFNLGHGILPGTPLESVTAVIDMVHEAHVPSASARL